MNSIIIKHLKLLMFALIMLLKTISLYGQQEASNWYFGDGVGIDFNCYPPRPLDGGKIKSIEGSSVISNECGELAFYTNGDTVFNGSHVVVTGGTNLAGDRRATQSSLIIKKPNSSVSYLVFTNDADENNNLQGLKYSEVAWLPPASNMISANNGLVNNTREMLTAVNHANNLAVWVITKLKSNQFWSYRVDNNGVDTAAVKSNVPFVSKESGQLKASPTGKLLVTRIPLKLYAFDNVTGDVTELFELTNSFLTDGNSIEFSPDGSKLYVNNYGGSTATDGIYQFDLRNLSKTAIENSAKKLPNITTAKGGMQLATNGKIYFISDSSDRWVGSFANVNDTILNIAVELKDITYLRPINTKFFPTFNQSHFFKSGVNLNMVCENDLTKLKLIPPYNQADSVSWDFGDLSSGANNFSKNIEPIHQFSNYGCFDLKAYVYKKGVTKIIEQRIKINKLPTTNLPKDTIVCRDPKILNLNASVAGENPATYLWDGYDVNFYKSIYSPGKHWLTKTYKCCEVTDTINVYFDSLKVDFDINDLIQCENDPDQNFKFKSTAILHGGGKITWSFDNGKTAVGDSASTSYDKYGFYYVTINIRSNSGCSNSGTKPIIVLKKPQAKFYIDTTKQCFVNNQFNIIDSSTLDFGMGLLDTVHYDFGDNTYSKSKKINKKYLSPDTYQIQLITASDQQCYDTLVKTIKVYENPKAGFIIKDSVQCLVENKFIYTDTTRTDDDSVKNHTWKYGNGIVNSLDSLNVEYSYPEANIYNVKLIATTVNGCKDSVTKHIVVHPNPNVFPSVIKDSLCFESNQFKFSAKHNLNKSILKELIWDLGDGGFIYDSMAVKKYDSHGDYTITYTARTDKGCSDSNKLNIHVIPSPKAVIVSSDTMPCFNKKEVKYDASNSISEEGNIESYYWDFGNGNSDNKVSPNIQLYNDPNPINVMLVVESSKKCRDTVYQHIKFLAQPTADIVINKNEDCLNNNNILMDGSNSVSSTGFIKKYYWHTGDGIIDSTSGKNLKYKYKDTGEFKITLVAKSNENCYDTATHSATINPNPMTDFTVSEACLTLPNNFTDKSTIIKGNIVKWIWKLDNGMVDSSGPITAFEYNKVGSYGVSLKTRSDKNCETEIYKKNVTVVKPIPDADFEWKTVDYGIDQTEILLKNKSINAIEYNWYSNDIYFSSDENSSYMYLDTLTAKITLIAKHPSGCFDTVNKFVFIAPEYLMYIPNAFTPNGDLNNEVFQPITNKFLNRFEMLIYNRWGELIFESNNPKKGWDGKHKGNFVQEGSYIYMIFVQDVRNQIHNYKGVINLIR